MATRNPFAFLDSESKDRTLLLLLLALIRKQGGEVTLSLEDLTAVEDGASFHKYPDDRGTSLVLRYARRGAEAYFLTASEESSSTPAKSRSTARPATARPQPDEAPSSPDLPPPPPRHSVHSDVDLALREEEMAEHARAVQQERLRQARAESGTLPWRTAPSTRQ
jgi:hypothetical protein